MPASELFLAVLLGSALVALAIGVRLGIHIGSQPGGVDTWYFLASAAALRKTRRLPISLPQYLLHDRTESYPPGFVVFLALLPPAWLRRYFWLVSPLIDAAHLVLVYVLTFRLTGSLIAAGVAGAVHALTPQLVAETRSLNPRAFGVLLSSVTMYLILRSLLPVPAGTDSHLGEFPWYVVASAIVVAAALFLSATGAGVAVLAATFGLSVVFADTRYFAIALAGLVCAVVLTGGFYLRVLANYLHAVRFWRRNIRYRGLHPILDSPIYGRDAPHARAANWQSGGTLRSAIRLIGENPFLVPMLLVATPSLAVEWWGQRMYWWALAILLWAFAVTFVKPLQVFGPGHPYMKASVMPTAFSLALVVVGTDSWRSPAGLLVALSFLASIGAIGVFYFYLRTRRSEHTSSTPPELAAIAADLGRAEGNGFLCLPLMYADYAAFASGKNVLWGGHSGDLSKLDALYPVIRRPLDELIAEYRLDYVLLDLAYTDPEQLRLTDRMRQVSRHGGFALYRTSR